jgi:hypothetical protein
VQLRFVAPVQAGQASDIPPGPGDGGRPAAAALLLQHLLRGLARREVRFEPNLDQIDGGLNDGDGDARMLRIPIKDFAKDATRWTVLAINVPALLARYTSKKSAYLKGLQLCSNM